jgi:hypothetical protein
MWPTRWPRGTEPLQQYAGFARRSRRFLMGCLTVIILRGCALGSLSHKLSDCRQQAEVIDGFLEKSLSPSVATALFVSRSVSSG